jgi:hypothetical protein
MPIRPIQLHAQTDSQQTRLTGAIVNPDNKEFYDHWKLFPGKTLRLAWYAICLYDLVLQACWRCV